MDLLHAAALFDEQGVPVDLLSRLGGRLVELADLEDVLETVQRDLDDLVVRAREQVAERLDAAAVDQIPNLLGLLEAAGRRVRNGPSKPSLRVLKSPLDRRWISGGMMLESITAWICWRVSGRDIGNGPAGLLF